MRTALVLMVVVAGALLCTGCAPKSAITADDMVAADTIVVTWNWPGGLLHPTSYRLLRAASPLPDDPGWSNPPVYAGSDTTYIDTHVSAGKAYFYKVQSFDGTQAGAVSWPEGGSTIGIPKNPARMMPFLTAAERAGNCIHTYIEKVHPHPEATLPIDETRTGSGGGTLRLQMYLDASTGLDAAAIFSFSRYTDTCTNGLTIVQGWQYAPVDVVHFNGFLRGWCEYPTGWQASYLDVKNRHASGGHWYINDGTVTAYVDYASFPWQGCKACISGFCCP